MEADDQAEIDRLVASLCRDLFVDNQTKYILLRDPIELILFDNDTWGIVYHMVDRSVVEIRAVARSRRR